MLNQKICSDCRTINDIHAVRCKSCSKMLDTPQTRYSRWSLLTTSLLAALIVVGLVIGVPALVQKLHGKNVPLSPAKVITPSSSSPTPTPTPLLLPSGLGVVQVAPDQYIGINDGSFAPFDAGRSTYPLKLQAAADLKSGNSSSALSLWNQALTLENSDAEALIYIENQRVHDSGVPYITLVAGVAFTAPFPDSSSESDLQGVYVAQHEFNQAHSNLKVRVLIANAGGNTSDATALAQQIVQIARHDSSLVGVIGWRYSAYSQQVIPVLSKAKIPLISSQSTGDALIGISPYFFRVVAPNRVEVQFAAPFIEKTLGFKNPVIFFDPGELYSQNLEQDFIAQFKIDGLSNIHTEAFKTDDKDAKDKFFALMQDAEKYHPDGFIFTGRSNADTGFFQDALPTSGPLATIKVFAGSGSYTAHLHSYGRWYLASVAYYGVDSTPIAKQFEQEYKDDFNALHQEPDGFYGYTIADDHAMVAYDATAAMLKAIDTFSQDGKTKPTPQGLAGELPKITGANAFQGVSGQIAFDNGDPINKAFVILFVSKNGSIQSRMIEGCFLKGCQ